MKKWAYEKWLWVVWYAEEYIDMLGYDRVMEIYRVEKNVYTDNEGLTYNSMIEEEYVCIYQIKI